VAQRILQSWHAAAETLRKVPERQVQDEPTSTVPLAGGQDVHEVAIIAQLAQEGSQAVQIFPLRKKPVAQRHCPPERKLPAAQEVQVLAVPVQVRHAREHREHVPPA
jgi:hypothetical protein